LKLNEALNRSYPTLLPGVLFAILWSSASAAGKFGLASAEPLVLFNLRFFGAGIIMLIYVHLLKKERYPANVEWKPLAIFGLLNTTLYLGLFIIALNEVTPGITTLAVALNPLFISILSAFWTKRRVLPREWFGIMIGIVGVLVAAYPHLETNFATTFGLVILGASQLSYSVGAVYYSSIEWTLPRTAINAWQVFIGGVLLVPATMIFYSRPTSFDVNLLLSLSWLIVPVSIVAVQLWLRLLKADAVRASMWLYLCPVFGFAYAALLFQEPLTVHTFVGTALVLGALYLGQKR
jgi:probable blue pigment (indigoidine) exporter